MTHNDFFAVKVHNATADAFGNMVGLLGNFTTGHTLARDRVTVLHDFTELGNEMASITCGCYALSCCRGATISSTVYPTRGSTEDRHRRLDESTVFEMDAKKACSQLKDPMDRNDCV